MVRIGARAVVLGAVVALVLGAGAALASAAGVALPDGRRFELVSPAAKNGVEVIPQTDKTHVRPDGGAVTFAALGGFATSEGSAFDFEYLAERTGAPGTPGWSTHGINPLARGTVFLSADPTASTYVNGFTSDLTVGVYKTWRPLVDAPNIADVSNLYRVTGLNGGPRTVQLLTGSVNPIPASWFTFFNGLLVKSMTAQTQPQIAGVSSDVRHVVFESPLALTADAPAYQGFCLLGGVGCPTLLYENADGVVRLVGRIPPGSDSTCEDSPGSGSPCVAADSSQTAISASPRFYSQLAISSDGRRIYFQAPGSGGFYLREDGVRTQLISPNGNFGAASADGSRAFFTTSDSLVGDDTDGGESDLYMYDRDAPALSPFTLISRGGSGNPGTTVGSSPDGHYVYFVFTGQLIAGEPTAFMGLYVWHDGELRHIGDFPDANVAFPNGTQTSWSFVSTARTSRITPDGQHLLFMTNDATGFAGHGGFAGYDQAGYVEFYLYDTVSGRLVCASCNPSGAPATTHALIDVRDQAATSANTSDSAQALTDDGRRVFFNSAETLVREDVNGRADAYEYDVASGRVRLLSSGRSSAPSYFIDASPNGDDVFIVTRERLVGWDVDESYDLYDARVGGGFPEPPASSPPCSADACLPAGATPRRSSSMASDAYRGAGNVRSRLKPHRRCGRKAVLRSVRGKKRCVKRRSHRSRRHATRAVVRVEGSGR